MGMEKWTIRDFTEQLSDKAPVPGGGGASALAGALGAALGHMAAALTVGKKRYVVYEQQLTQRMQDLQTYRHALLMGIQQDADAFLTLREAYSLRAHTEQDKAIKAEAIQRALMVAVQPPMDILSNCEMVTQSLLALYPMTSRLVISDIGCAAAMCRACMEAALLNVLINTGSMADRDKAHALENQAKELCTQGMSRCEDVYKAVKGSLCKEN